MSGKKTSADSKTAHKAKSTQDKPTASLIDMTQAVKQMADRGVAHAKETYQTMKSFADETSGAVEQSYSLASKGFGDLNSRFVEMARTNVNAYFDACNQLTKVTSLSDLVDVQSKLASKQLEVARKQWNEISGLTTEMANETFNPLKETLSKSFKIPA